VLTECSKPPGVDRNEISYAEIGETPGVPGGTVMSRRLRAGKAPCAICWQPNYRGLRAMRC